jgi:hypothetical protein
MTHVVGPNNLELVIRHEPTMRLNPGDRVGVIVTGEALAFPEAVDVTTRE